MKKIILMAAMIIGFAVAATAQPRSIGARIGNGAEISYQHTLGGANFLEIDGGLGLPFDGTLSVGATGIYNFMIAQPAWTDRGEWGFYAGPGAALGMGLTSENDYFHLAIAGMVGLEYSFWFPLQLSFDLRPQVGAAFSGHGLYWSIMPALGIRYRF